MSALIIWIGVGVAAIGVVLTTNGLVIYQSTFGNALAVVGGIALVGGLVIVALGYIYRVLLQISEKLDGAMLPYEAEEDEAPLPEPVAARPSAPPVPAAPPVTRAAPEPARRDPPPVAAPAAPAPRARAVPVTPPEPAALEPALPDPASAAAAGSALPSWFRRNRESAPPPPAPPPPPVATRNFHLDHDEDDERPAPRSTRGPFPTFEEDEGREDFPVVVRSGPFNYGLEPQEGGEDLEPVAPSRPPEDETVPHRNTPPEADADIGELPAFLRPSVEPEVEPAPEPVPAPRSVEPPAAPPPPQPLRTPRAPTVLKSGFIGGMAYTLYSDGSIEAELPDGVLRFASLQALREHVAGTMKTEE